jgi:hypothetical protein
VLAFGGRGVQGFSSVRGSSDQWVDYAPRGGPALSPKWARLFAGGRKQAVVLTEDLAQSRVHAFDDRTGALGTLFSVSQFATDLVTGDVNGDGIDELGVQRVDARGLGFDLYRSENGSFRRYDEWDVRALAIGDLQRDGFPEIVWANGNELNTMSFDASFSALGTGEPVVLPFVAETIALADLDGDGGLDTVAFNSGYVAVRKNTGGLTIAALPIHAMKGQFAIGDLTGNGRPELVFTDGLRIAVLSPR